MINVLSLGAGKQSCYMLLNALEGKYKYIPDFAIFADTGCEPEYVYKQLFWIKNYVENKYCFKIVIVSNGNLMEDTLSYLSGERKRVACLPLRLNDGGLLKRQCTLEYKTNPIRKYLQKVRKNESIRFMIGISLDEKERIKKSDVKYIEHYYPLIEDEILLSQIINWYKLVGLPEPGKSACIICPFHSDNYWRVFKKQFPKEFKQACGFDDKIRNYPNLKSETYLSRHLKPLRNINFTQHPSLFPELIEDCHGLCGL